MDLQISSPDGSTLVIDQGSSRAASDWQSFDIGDGERVIVNQPDTSSLLLGRVVGGSATQILGSLSANGGLLLVNPYGLLIGSDAVINAATFSASTSDVDPDQFMNGGDIRFLSSPLTPSDAKIINDIPSLNLYPKK